MRRRKNTRRLKRKSLRPFVPGQTGPRQCFQNIFLGCARRTHLVRVLNSKNKFAPMPLGKGIVEQRNIRATNVWRPRWGRRNASSYCFSAHEYPLPGSPVTCFRRSSLQQRGRRSSAPTHSVGHEPCPNQSAKAIAKPLQQIDIPAFIAMVLQESQPQSRRQKPCTLPKNNLAM